MFLEIGISKRKPIKSEKKPGIIRNRAANAINKRLYITIASMLAYGAALENSGAAQLIVKNPNFIFNKIANLFLKLFIKNSIV